MKTIKNIILEEINQFNSAADFNIDKVQQIADNLQKGGWWLDDYIIANVNVDLVDKAWQEDKHHYIGKDNKGLDNRKDNIKTNITLGTLRDAPVVKIVLDKNNKPIVVFNDGRHRFAVLRDLGVKTINLAFPKNVEHLIPLLQKK